MSEEYIAKLKKIFYERYEVNIDNNWHQVKDYPLLGYKMGIGPGELLYLYFDIENEFNIKIPEEAIINGGFNTLDSILNIILNEKAGKNC